MLRRLFFSECPKSYPYLLSKLLTVSITINLITGSFTSAPPAHAEEAVDDEDNAFNVGLREASTRLTANFRSSTTRKFLTVEDDANQTLRVNRDVADAWENLQILDANGGELQSGDIIFIQGRVGSYLQAVNGGGSEVNILSRNTLDWETFRIVRAQGAGRVASGDAIGLQTFTGQWFGLTGSGSEAVFAQSKSFSALETFTIQFPEASAWKLKWSDEFNGPGIDEGKWSWEVRPPGWVNNELQNYTDHRPENARIENGSLIIEARRDGFQGREYSSARLKTQGKVSWTYGRIEARIQVPVGKGTWPAFWLMPDNMSRGWPACGEMDIMEHVGYEPNVVHSTTHSLRYNWKAAEQRTAATWVAGAVDGYHVYAMEWYPDRIEFFVDGNRYHTSRNDNTGDDAWPFNKNFHIILNVAVGGDWGGAQGVDPNIWPQQMKVDWIKVYQK